MNNAEMMIGNEPKQGRYDTRETPAGWLWFFDYKMRGVISASANVSGEGFKTEAAARNHAIASGVVIDD